MGSEVVEFVEPPQQFDISMDPGGRTALHLAIAHSHPRVVDILLNHKGEGEGIRGKGLGGGGGGGRTAFHPRVKAWKTFS